MGKRPVQYTPDSWGERDVRLDAADALVRFGKHAQDALPALEKLRNDESADVLTRVIAAFAILRIVPENAEAMPGFIALLDDDAAWQMDCVPLLSAFKELGSKATGAVPVITRKLNHDDYSVRWPAIRALIYVKGMDAIPDLARLLKHADVSTRCFAADELGEFGPQAKAVVPALSDLLSETPDENGESAKCSAIVALGKIGPPAKSAIPRLRELLKDADLNSEVSEALKRISGE